MARHRLPAVVSAGPGLLAGPVIVPPVPDLRRAIPVPTASFSRAA